MASQCVISDWCHLLGYTEEGLVTGTVHQIGAAIHLGEAGTTQRPLSSLPSLAHRHRCFAALSPLLPQALLCSPEPDDPQDAEVASQYKRDHAAFVATARYWTGVYAAASTATAGADEKVEALVAMGFEAAAARAALAAVGGDVERAAERLMS